MLHRRTVAVFSKHILKPLSPFFNPTPTTTATGAAAMGEGEPPKTNNGAARSIEEPDVGIFCYISKLPGFRGILKQRYSDFIVNEVDLEGNVVHLTSMDVPPEMVQKRELKLPEQHDKSYTSEIESFRSLAGDSDADQLKDFIEKLNSGSEDIASSFVLSPSSDKSHRTAVHNFFKEKMNFLVTDTVDGPDQSSKCIRVRLDSGGNQSKGKASRKRKDRGGKPFDSRGSDDWPEHLGKFLRFHLYKENKDTQEALRLIGKMLGIQPRSFGFSGTKDKRAVTTQRVTVFKIRARRLASLNERLFGIKFGDFSYAKDGLVLGQLLGNRFTITLRGVVAESEETIKAALSDLGKYGFINYFGLQRFGSGTVPTYRIGSALLKGEWKTAVNMILDPRDGERDDIQKIREHYKETNDVDGTLRQLPHNMVAERAILQCLKKSPGNYLQALKAIPRTMRMMYVHSYQSYLWNHAASIRVQKYGAEKVLLGDLVYSKEDGSHDNIPGVHTSECEDDATIDGVNGSHADELSEVDLPGDRCQPVKAIDAEDLLKGNYTAEDIVLPLPGSRATYPMNDIADIYHDLAKKDDISLTESKHNVKEFSITSMTGGYRRVFQKPIDFEWEILKYTDGNKPLAETDMDKITISKPVESSELQPESKASDTRENPDAQETQTALKLCFTLPASCYATMAIRELLKTSTSVAFHKALNG